MPPLRFGAGSCEDLTALVGLPGCLPGDPEGSSDLGPTGSLSACCVDHETRCELEGLSGVSQPLKVLHRPLRAASSAAQGVDGPRHPPTRVSPGFGAHEGMKTDVADIASAIHGVGRKRCLLIANSACSQLPREFGNRRRGRAFVALREFGGGMSGNSGLAWPGLVPTERPRTVAAAGVVTTDQEAIR